MIPTRATGGVDGAVLLPQPVSHHASSNAEKRIPLACCPVKHTWRFRGGRRSVLNGATGYCRRALPHRTTVQRLLAPVASAIRLLARSHSRSHQFVSLHLARAMLLAQLSGFCALVVGTHKVLFASVADRQYQHPRALDSTNDAIWRVRQLPNRGPREIWCDTALYDGTAGLMEVIRRASRPRSALKAPAAPAIQGG